MRKGSRKTFEKGQRRDADAQQEALDARNRRLADEIVRVWGGSVEQRGSTFEIHPPEQTFPKTSK